MLGVYRRAHAVLAALLDLSFEGFNFLFRWVWCHILICLVKLGLSSRQRMTIFLSENNYVLVGE